MSVGCVQLLFMYAHTYAHALTARLLVAVAQLGDPWDRAQDMMLRGTVVEGTITGFNQGGVLVELGDLKGAQCAPRAPCCPATDLQLPQHCTAANVQPPWENYAIVDQDGRRTFHA